MTPEDSNGRPPRPYSKSGLYELKRSVSVLGRRMVDRRTSVGKALAAWRRELLADLGGSETVSTMELALVEEAVTTKLLLSSLNAWLLEQPSLVNKRNRSALPVVRDRNALVATLRGLLGDLGLKRRSREEQTVAEIAKEYAEADATAGAPAEPAP